MERKLFPGVIYRSDMEPTMAYGLLLIGVIFIFVNSGF